MHSPIALRSLALACVVIASCASSSQRRLEDRPMPIHLAVIPVTEPKITGSSFIDQIDAEQDDALTLEIDGPEFSRQLAETLAGALAEDEDDLVRGRRFGMLTLLPVPDEEEHQKRSRTQRQQYWVDAARDISADYLLELELEHSTAVASELNGQFLFEVSLYLFLGPLSYFIDDRSYWVDARLFGNIYDLNALSDESGLDRSALVMPVVSNFSQMDTDYIDRLDIKKPQDLIYSTLLPPGFLAESTDRVQQFVRAATTEGLTSEFASTMRLKQRELYEANRVGGVALDPVHWNWDLSPEDGTVRVAGRLWFDPDQEHLGEGLANVRPAVHTARFTREGSGSGFVEAGPFEEGEGLLEANLDYKNEQWRPLEAGFYMTDVDVQATGEPLKFELPEADPGADKKVAYDFEVTLPVDAETYAVRIEVDVLGNRARQRSFTFVIDEELRTRIEAAKALPVEDVGEPAGQGSLGATASAGD